MPGKKVVIPREKEIPLAQLLGAIGLTEVGWATYLAILEHPDLKREDLVDLPPDQLRELSDQGLLQPSRDRSLGFEACAPGPALSALMQKHDDAMLRKMQAGVQLRQLMRGITEAPSSPTGRMLGSGIEVYEEISKARDRIYELSDRATNQEQFLFESEFRSPTPEVARSYVSARPADNEMGSPALCTTVVDRNAQRQASADDLLRVHWIARMERGERTLAFPGQLPQLMLRQDSHLVLWKDPFPSRSATVIVTSPWAVRLAAALVNIVLPLCDVWTPDGAERPSDPESVVAALLTKGLTDEQISSRTGLSVRTVGRQVASLMETLGARTRFQAGVLIERRHWAAKAASAPEGP